MAGRLYKAETSLCSEVSSERPVCDQGVDLFAQVSKRRVEIERLLTTFVTQRDLFLFYRRSA